MNFEYPRFNKVIFNDRVYTHQELCFSIDSLCTFLEQNIESSSPFVYLFAYNHIKTLVAYFGALKAGLSVVLVDPETGPLELKDMFRDSPPGILVKMNPDTPGFTEKEFVFLKPREETLPTKPYHGYTLVYTSADDGLSKAALLSEKNILCNAKALAGINETDERSTIVSLIPFHHLFGFTTGLLSPLISGSTLFLYDMRHIMSVANLAGQIGKHGITDIYSVPLVYYLLSKIPEFKEKARNFHCLTTGGYKMPRTLHELYVNRFGISLHEGYGLTEASPICSWHRPKDPIKPDSVGRVFPCCEIKTFGPGDEELPRGGEGEICIRGENVMEGYLQKPEATEKALRNGWLHTGDIGKVDEEGFLYLTGLKKRMLNVAGKKVFPSEVERYMNQNPNLGFVEIYGQKSPLEGEVLRARIKLKDNSRESQASFRKWCMESLSHYKVPKHMEFL